VGLLEELKQEADRAREAKEIEAVRLKKLNHVYRAEIAPRLLLVHRYLTEMLKHMRDADRFVNAAFEFPALGRIENLRQDNYTLRIDGHESPKKVNLNCDCSLPEERKFAVAKSGAEDFRQFLISNQVAFTEWPVRSGFGEIGSFQFQAKLRVRSSLAFEADIEASRIRILSYNFEGLSLREYLFGYERVDNAWLDDLGRYLLREKGHLGRLEISEEARALIRQRAAEEKARLTREVWGGGSPAPVAAPEKKPPERGLLRRWFKSDDKDG
jgi:hypothetical protein